MWSGAEKQSRQEAVLQISINISFTTWKVSEAHLVPETLYWLFRLFGFQSIQQFLKTILPGLQIQYPNHFITKLIAFMSPSLRSGNLRLDSMGELTVQAETVEGNPDLIST